MQKIVLVILLFYSIVITALFIHSMSEGANKIVLEEENENSLSLPEEDLSKIEARIQKQNVQTTVAKNIEKQPANHQQVLEEDDEPSEDSGPTVIPEEIQKEDEKFQDDNSEKMLAYFEQAVGINLTAEQEQKALSAFRAIGESDPTAVADADTAFLDKKLNLSKEQKTKVRKAITEFNTEPDTDAEEISSSDVEQIENQNQAFFNQVAPLLDEKQKNDLMQMMQDGTSFADE